MRFVPLGIPRRDISAECSPLEECSRAMDISAQSLRDVDARARSFEHGAGAGRTGHRARRRTAGRCALIVAPDGDADRAGPPYYSVLLFGIDSDGCVILVLELVSFVVGCCVVALVVAYGCRMPCRGCAVRVLLPAPGCFRLPDKSNDCVEYLPLPRRSNARLV